MVTTEVLLTVAAAKEKADSSVDYLPRYGAVCPECGRKKLPVITSRKWEDNIKVRFHRCPNKKNGCLLAVMGVSIKSVQVAD